jgi:ceramide glucosyltransferase
MLSAVSICLIICTIALALHALGAWATVRQTARTQPERPTFPPLTLLKPIKGLEEELEQNLRSFFEQRYPAPLSFVFASTSPDDPGIQVARRIARQYPDTPCQFVVSDPSFGKNPKVSNLAGALCAAEHDLVLQTDANVRLRPGYLTAVVGELLGNEANLLGALVAGSGERSLGAALENVQLSTFITPGICLAYRVFKIPCVIGKSILFRKSELNAWAGSPV